MNRLYKPGSSIKFYCKAGFFLYSNHTLTSVCQPNGTWSYPGDCMPPPCWNRMPRRPLNGNREIGVVLNTNGSVHGSHVNFTCNRFYELSGRERLFCLGREWEKDVPECRLTRRLCRERPVAFANQAFLKSVQRVEFKAELNYTSSHMVTVFTKAMYVCAANTQFKIKTNIGSR